MDAGMRFLFDLEGYLVLDDVLSPALLATLNAEVDKRAASSCNPSTKLFHFGDGRFTGVPEGSPYNWAHLGVEKDLTGHCSSGAAGPGPVFWGRPFFDALAAPKLQAVLRDLLGSSLRLDHDYLQLIRPAARGSHDAGVGVHGYPHGNRSGNTFYRVFFETV